MTKENEDSTVAPAEVGALRLTLDVKYDLNGETLQFLKERLQRMVERAIGDGMLSGDSMAEVGEYGVTVAIAPEPVSEKEIAAFMLQRIENGDLDLGDIPVRLARYGLMQPHDFVEEMRERQDMLEADDRQVVIPGFVQR